MCAVLHHALDGSFGLKRHKAKAAVLGLVVFGLKTVGRFRGFRAWGKRRARRVGLEAKGDTCAVTGQEAPLGHKKEVRGAQEKGEGRRERGGGKWIQKRTVPGAVRRYLPHSHHTYRTVITLTAQSSHSGRGRKRDPSQNHHAQRCGQCETASVEWKQLAV